MVGAEISGPRTEIPGLDGDAVILNEGNLTFARVAFDERTFAALRAVALNTGDALSEAVCWTTAWHMVTTAEPPAAEFAELLTRRLRLDPPLPVPGLEVLTTRAVTAADVWAPTERRAALRELLADEFFDMTKRRPADPAVKHALTAGFAAGAESSSQLALLRTWLSESWPDSALRWKFLAALSARGLASDAEIEGMAAADPADGEPAAATCLARRPDPVSKAAAWDAALKAAAARRWRMARAHAEGFWVAGQEALLRTFRDRYFGGALPTLISLSGTDPSTASQTRRLATLLFPATLAGEATVAAVRDALGGPLPKPWRDLLAEREIELRLRIFSKS